MNETDFLLRCEQCGHGQGKLVAKYQWMEDQGHWVPVPVRGHQNVTITSLRGNVVDDWWFQHLEDDHELAQSVPIGNKQGDIKPLRSHHEIVCHTKGCANKVAADDQSIQFIFLLIGRAVVDAQKPDRPEWVRMLAGLAAVDRDKQTTTLTISQLRAALTLNNSKWARHTRKS